MSFVKLRSDNDADKGTLSTSPVHSIGAGMSKPETLLGKGVKVVGTLKFTGTAEIDGYIEGEIHAEESLVIGESAIVQAKIFGSDVTVKGTVQGDIVASKRLMIRRPGKVVGNITCPSLGIEEGASLEGRCSMSSAGVNPNANMSNTSGSGLNAGNGLGKSSIGTAGIGKSGLAA